MSEILERDKDWSKPLLQKALSDSKLESKLVGDRNGDVGRDFALLIATRRVEGASDPLVVNVVAHPPVIKTPTNQLPMLKVIVKNVDDNQSVFFKFGGDTRSGRPSRWRVVVKDEQGKEAKHILRFGFMGGGLASIGPLKPGETFDTTLAVRDFIESPPPGKYTLQVLFHNKHDLSEIQDVSGIVVSQSKPIELILEKIPIRTSAAKSVEVRRLIDELDEAVPLKVLVGTYGPWAHATIAPDSPAGKLLANGPAAVPPLVAAVQEKDLSTEKRAWLLAILYSLTGENDPRQERDVLGAHSFVGGPWATWTGKNGDPLAASFGIYSSGSVSAGEPKQEKQLEFAAKWNEWLATNCNVIKE